MRILFSVHGYKPAWRVGGPVVSVSSLAETLVAKGHEVTVFTTNSNLDQDLDVPTDRLINVDGVQVRYFARQEPIKRLLPGVKYLSQSIGALYTPEMPAALEAISRRVDLMHTHIPFVYPTLATARAARRARLPLFYHQRGVFDPERLKFRALKKRIYLGLVEKPILHRATTLVALTEAERSSYGALGVRTPVRVVPNGIRLPSPPDLVAHTNAVAHLQIPPEAPVVLFMGRLHPVKGADRLLKAFLPLARQFPDARLILAGPDEFGIEAAFRAQVLAAGAGTQVIFPGMVSGHLKSALLHRANLFCLPSDAEGFSMAILEALAHETAVLISPRCHFPEVVASGAGRVVEPTVPALADALAAFLREPAQLSPMGAAGRRLVAARFTWDSVAELMLDAYGEGLDRHRRGFR